MSKAVPWYKRLYKFLVGYGEDTPTLIVVTPLVPDAKPLTVSVPARDVAAVVRKPRKKVRRRVK